MRSPELDNAYSAVLACFEHQPIAPKVRDQWMDYLRKVDEPTFRVALRRCRDQGGSQFSNQPGRRPGVAEFAALVRVVQAERSRASQPADEPWPEKDPVAAHKAVIEIKAQLGQKASVR